MEGLILFLAARLLSKSFWLLVLSTFLGVLLLAMRSFYRNSIFQEAAREAQPSRFYSANRF
jgi:hypothetical protein